MLISWRWLQDYIKLDISHDELAERLAMSGLNHEGTETVGDDFAIDLEVTSNRPDCLGHIGVAREAAVLCDVPLQLPNPSPAGTRGVVDELTRITIEAGEHCACYTARIVRGVKIGPSPDWLVQKLATVGVAPINNIVDITNFVLMECGQPLHAFDFAKLQGSKIIVRCAIEGEEFQAINHRTYALKSTDCVIADAERPVALGGVMGGVDTEVSGRTTEVLVEAADFAPLAIRTTARRLNLHSPSSYRFERGVDPMGVDWASRRCCELILELAGGELAEGVVDIRAQQVHKPQPITLRLSQLPRILGINVPESKVRHILTALGNTTVNAGSDKMVVTPPSWRRDLTREIDLIEEVARIHGYDRIPEDVGVAMVASHRTDFERVVVKIRESLTACGFSEALTPSVVSDVHSAVFCPWTEATPLHSSIPMLRGADRLRRSLIPSLLLARQTNEALANSTIELFEIAKVYLSTASGLPEEPWILAFTSGRQWDQVKGVLEVLIGSLNPRHRLSTVDWSGQFFEPKRACGLLLNGERVGCLGEVGAGALQKIGLRERTIVAELRLAPLQSISDLIPQYKPPSLFPSISRDVNLIVGESVTWAALANTVAEICGSMLERLEYRETYRDPHRDGDDKKRLLFSFVLRSTSDTLTGEQADAIRDRVVEKCCESHDATMID